MAVFFSLCGLQSTFSTLFAGHHQQLALQLHPLYPFMASSVSFWRHIRCSFLFFLRGLVAMFWFGHDLIFCPVSLAYWDMSYILNRFIPFWSIHWFHVASTNNSSHLTVVFKVISLHF